MNDMSLKAKLNNLSKLKNIAPQAVLQSYLMNRFLYRLSVTDYKDKFVIKGGMLISSIIGIEQRSTMDLDSTLRNIPMTADTIKDAFNVIASVQTEDGIIYTFNSIEPIRDDDEYGGYRVSYTAEFGKIKAPMTMDISTGDVITPGARLHSFTDLLDKEISFELWSYPVETILAEKVETILSRGIDNTRPRDYYDVYMLSELSFDKDVFFEAFKATAKHRESADKICNYEEILDGIRNNKEMNNRWKKYSKVMSYAKNIEFDVILEKIDRLLKNGRCSD